MLSKHGFGLTDRFVTFFSDDNCTTVLAIFGERCFDVVGVMEVGGEEIESISSSMAIVFRLAMRSFCLISLAACL